MIKILIFLDDAREYKFLFYWDITSAGRWVTELTGKKNQSMDVSSAAFFVPPNAGVCWWISRASHEGSYSSRSQSKKKTGRRNFLNVCDRSQKKRVRVLLLLLHCVFGTDSAGISVANDLVAWCQHATVGQTRLVFNTNSSSSFMCAAAAVLLLMPPSRVISARCWLSVECSLRRMCSVFLF